MHSMEMKLCFMFDILFFFLHLFFFLTYVWYFVVLTKRKNCQKIQKKKYNKNAQKIGYVYDFDDPKGENLDCSSCYTNPNDFWKRCTNSTLCV